MSKYKYPYFSQLVAALIMLVISIGISLIFYAYPWLVFNDAYEVTK